MSPKYPKSPVGWLTSETSAVVCLGLALPGRWGIFPHTSKKLNAVAMTTAVDHGKMLTKAVEQKKKTDDFNAKKGEVIFACRDFCLRHICWSSGQ